ncbi:MAG TPA: phenylalanine--tRNA ligase subunit alpha, partial [Ilumatobacteraceae bacterium]|nr:phenylalanine--tRNA ligase subunit alpha [Ilumatobacteraceae bacterium]
MIEEVKQAAETALERVSQASTAEEVRALEAELLGKRGPFATFKTGLGALATVDDKRAAGQALNDATTLVTEALAARRRELAAAERIEQLAAERMDLTEVMSWPKRGHAHVVTQAWERLEDV